MYASVDRIKELTLLCTLVQRHRASGMAAGIGTRTLSWFNYLCESTVIQTLDLQEQMVDALKSGRRQEDKASDRPSAKQRKVGPSLSPWSWFNSVTVSPTQFRAVPSRPLNGSKERPWSLYLSIL